MDSSAKLALLIFGLQSARMKTGGTNYRIRIFGEIWRKENRFGGEAICSEAEAPRVCRLTARVDSTSWAGEGVEKSASKKEFSKLGDANPC